MATVIPIAHNHDNRSSPAYSSCGLALGLSGICQGPPDFLFLRISLDFFTDIIYWFFLISKMDFYGFLIESWVHFSLYSPSKTMGISVKKSSLIPKILTRRAPISTYIMLFITSVIRKFSSWIDPVLPVTRHSHSTNFREELPTPKVFF